MINILEYINENYTLFLGGAIIILLAIIGSYADKTNFGQGKTKEDKDNNKKENEIDLSNKKLGDLFDDISKSEPQENNSNSVKDEKVTIDELSTPIEDVLNHNIPDSLKHSEPEKKEKETANKFDQEFKQIIPDKNLINGDLLSDIDSMTLDSKKELTSLDIPDLDDVDLPEIKNIKETDDDIWKL